MARTGFDEVVMLTGFPSFVARRICSELLRTSERTLVHAIVRSKFGAEAQAALDAMPADDRARVNTVQGDAAAMDLGLSGAEFRALTKEVDRIHHCAEVTPVTYSCANTEQLLSGTDIRCPAFDTYVERLVAYVQQRRRGRREKKAHAPTDDPLM